MNKKIICTLMTILYLTSCTTNSSFSNDDSEQKAGIPLSEHITVLFNNFDKIPLFVSNEKNIKQNVFKRASLFKTNDDNLLDFPSFDISQIEYSSYDGCDSKFLEATNYVNTCKGLKNKYLNTIKQYGDWIYEDGTFVRKVKIDYYSNTDTLIISKYEYFGEFGYSYTVAKSSYDIDGRINISSFTTSIDYNNPDIVYYKSIDYIEGVRNIYAQKETKYINGYLNETISIAEECFIKGQEKRVIVSATPSSYCAYIFFDTDHFNYLVQIDKASFENPLNHYVTIFNKENGYTVGQVRTTEEKKGNESIDISVSLLNNINKAYYKKSIYQPDNFQDASIYLKINDKIYGNNDDDYAFMQYGYDGLYPSRVFCGTDNESNMYFSPAILYSYDKEYYNIDYYGINNKNIYDGFVNGLAKYDVTINAEFINEIKDCTINLNNMLHELKIGNDLFLDDLSIDKIFALFKNYEKYSTDYKSLRNDFIAAGGIKYNEQHENNDRIININASLNVNGQFDTNTKDINIKHEEVIISKNQLLVENGSYSLLIGLASASSFIELYRQDTIFNNEDLCFKLDNIAFNLNNKSIIDDGTYNLVCFVVEAKNNKDYRITNSFPIKINAFNEITDINVNEELKDEKMVEVINGNVYKILYTSKYTTTTTYSYTFKNGCLAISKNTDIKIDRTIISKSKI
ncbi:MAG: hypothetical protein SOU19_08085 [Candidatus Caccosoma sp.]|nr:hypothetical protein [Candidatus Caccosoma sp.]